MMDKQVDNLGIKCIEMTFALYNSDICTHIKIDINPSRLTVRVSRMSLTPQILYLDADQPPFFTQSSRDYTLDFDMLFDLLLIPLPELQSNSATTFGLSLSRRKQVLSNILNSSKGDN